MDSAGNRLKIREFRREIRREAGSDYDRPTRVKQFASACQRLTRNAGRIYPHPWLAILFLGIALGELSVLALNENSFWNNPGLNWYEMLSLICLSVLTWASVSWIFWWIAGYTVSQNLSRRRRHLSFALLVMGFGALLFFLSCSWIFYLRTGAFLDLEALQFGSSNLLMMGHYIWQAERMAFLLTSAACLAGSLLAITAFSRLYSSTEIGPSNWTHPKVGKLCLFLTVELACVLVFFSYMNKREAIAAGFWWKHAGPGSGYEVKNRLNPLVTVVTKSVVQGISSDTVQGEIATEDLGPRLTTEYKANQSAPEPDEPYSVIYIAVEALRHDVVQLKHQGQEVMPHLNRLARSGLHFTHSYAQSTHSNYADPCLFSSLYPLRTPQHHVYSRSDPWPKTMLYDVLKQRGYATAIYSSQNETWGHMDAFLESPQLDVFYDSRSHDGPTHIPAKDTSFSYYARNTHVAGKLDDAITMQQAIKWIDAQDKHKTPFALCMNLQTSHFPYELPPGQTGPFQPGVLDFPASFVSYPKEKIPVVRNAYFNSLHYIDQQIGKLVAYLEQNQLREKTLIVIAGDQGEAFYENGYPTHAGPPYEPAVRVALVMDCPGLLEPKEISYLTQAIDIVPTICGQLKVPIHPGFQGINVLADDRPPLEARCAFIHCESNISKSDALINGTGWKLIHDRNKDVLRLYNLVTDPGEQTDLSQQKPELCQSMAALLHKWRRQQLLYYQNPSYYGFYYPPRTPQVSAELMESLTVR